jgi:hypothetical protein
MKSVESIAKYQIHEHRDEGIALTFKIVIEFIN